MCPPNLVLELSTTWETAFCTCLRGSSDPLMKTAKDCSIVRLEDKSQKKDQDYHKIEPLADDKIYTDHETAYSFSVTSSEEPVETNNHDEFINQCLLSSYNSIHDPSKYFIDSVTQESEQILPPSFAMSDHDNLGKFLLRVLRYLDEKATHYCLLQISIGQDERSHAFSLLLLLEILCHE
jgi:hypothetical protein